MYLPKRTSLAPFWYEVVADGYSHHFETLEEAQAEKESFSLQGVDVEDEIYRDSCLPLGSYFVGDPSLVLKDWEDGKDTKYPLDNGVYLFNKESFFAIYKAVNGPGSYYDEKGNLYSTKSGCLAFLPINDDDASYELDSFIDLDECEALQEDGEAYIYDIENAIDTGIDRQCPGAIDFGGNPFVFTGDECWYEGD